MQCEMQSVLSRIWTRVAVSIAYDDNHYTTGTSSLVYFNTLSGRRDYFYWFQKKFPRPKNGR